MQHTSEDSQHGLKLSLLGRVFTLREMSSMSICEVAPRYSECECVLSVVHSTRQAHRRSVVEPMVEQCFET